MKINFTSATKRILSVSACLVFIANTYSQHNHDGMPATDSNQYFKLLKGLVGNWKGHYQWSTNKAANGEMDASYSLTGNGSAVVEDLLSGGVKSMTSVYHMDGVNLRMTHFCGANNQPRLIADTTQSTGNSVTFTFVDITNLKNPDAGHVFGVKITFVSPDRININYRFTTKGAESDELIELTRQPAASSN